MRGPYKFEFRRRNIMLGASAAVATIAATTGTAAAQPTSTDAQDTKRELTGKRALVTGASRGIGAVIALRCSYHPPLRLNA